MLIFTFTGCLTVAGYAIYAIFSSSRDSLLMTKK